MLISCWSSLNGYHAGQDIGFSVEYVSPSGETMVSLLCLSCEALQLRIRKLSSPDSMCLASLFAHTFHFLQLILPYRRYESDQVSFHFFVYLSTFSINGGYPSPRSAWRRAHIFACRGTSAPSQLGATSSSGTTPTRPSSRRWESYDVLAWVSKQDPNWAGDYCEC